jgi:hypothetical protein
MDPIVVDPIADTGGLDALDPYPISDPFSG